MQNTILVICIVFNFSTIVIQRIKTVFRVLYYTKNKKNIKTLKHLKMHKYGQTTNNFSKIITFHNSHVEKLVIAWVCDHLERLQKYEFRYEILRILEK